MSNELRFPTGGRDGRDVELGELLRPLYAAPESEAYWEGLEARIMGGVAGAAPGAPTAEWWLVLSRWSRAGAAAAVMAAAAAGALWLQHRAAESRMAYERVLSEPPVYSMELGPDELGAPPAESPPPGPSR